MAMIAMRNNAVVGSNTGVFLFALLPHLLACGFGCLIAIYLIIFEVRWGHLPPSLLLAGRTVTYTTPGFWGMNERTFDIAGINSFEVQSVRDIFGRKNSFKLTIGCAGNAKVSREFSTHDGELPNRIQRAFAHRISATRRDTTALRE
jgi:hypothetical protein